jgi:peptidoglycan/LPS O-acetylase OafA/YrhL
VTSVACQPETAGSHRLQSLDMLRGVAVLMVLAVHAPLPNGVKSFIDEREIGRLLATLISLGSYGVDLFFVLSGFLISGILFSELAKTGTLDVRRFWMRRGLKIWPSYFAAYGSVVIFMLVRDVLRNQGEAQGLITAALVRALPNILFVQNYASDSRWFASWSLAIEEHFYLLLPLLLLMLAATKRLMLFIPLACVLICIVIGLIRWYALRNGVSPDVIYLQTHFRIDGLCFGVCLGYMNSFHKRAILIPKSLSLMLLFFSLALMPAFFFPWGHGITENAGLTVMYLGFGGVVAIAAAHPGIGLSSPGAPLFRSLSAVGGYSYTIYLAQWGALSLAESRVLDPLCAMAFRASIDCRWIVFISGSLFGGVILSYVIERPFLKLRERWYPKSASEPAMQEVQPTGLH